jgi:nicotinate phosphoribosyltransferase
VDPVHPWRQKYFENCTFKDLLKPVFVRGERMNKHVDVKEIREYVKQQLATEIWEEEQRFENPHTHYVDMSPALYELKMNLLHEERR